MVIESPLSILSLQCRYNLGSRRRQITLSLQWHEAQHSSISNIDSWSLGARRARLCQLFLRPACWQEPPSLPLLPSAFQTCLDVSFLLFAPLLCLSARSGFWNGCDNTDESCALPVFALVIRAMGAPTIGTVSRERPEKAAKVCCNGFCVMAMRKHNRVFVCLP